MVASPVRQVPARGLIPALKPLYDYNWVVGFAAALILYRGLTLFRPRRTAPGSVPGPRAETADLPAG